MCIRDSLIDRVLIIKDFQKDDKKHVPASFVDNQIAEQLTEQFDNDRSKFLAYLRARGTTMREYRKEVEEDIIYNYMVRQQRKSQSIVSPIRIEQYYNCLLYTSGRTSSAIPSRPPCCGVSRSCTCLLYTSRCV